eukprot:Rmarinus@m.5755
MPAILRELRCKEVAGHFSKCFDGAPSFVGCSPGRVNLIGEHIDYNGFGVLPIALDQCSFVAIRKCHCNSDSPRMTVCHKDPEQFPAETIDLAVGMSPPSDKTRWAHYVYAGYLAACEVLEKEADSILKSNSDDIQIFVSGEVPHGAGLSSSSSLVCTSCLSFLSLANGIWDRIRAPTCGTRARVFAARVAAACARAERFVGTQGGGMDQAASLLSIEGNALRVNFRPKLDTSCVKLPRNTAVVIIDSGVVKRKAADFDFNTRVLECSLAAAVLLRKASLRAPLPENILDSRLYHVVPEFFDSGNWKGREKILNQALELVNSHLLKEEYTLQNIIELLRSPDGTCTASEQDRFCIDNVDTFVERLRQACGCDPWLRPFHLRARARHVFREALRVEEFCRLCDTLARDVQDSKTEEDPEAVSECVQALGSILNESHASMKDDYEASHPTVDQIAELCRESGAIGARVTGAGWGGCVLALVRASEAEAFLKEIQERMYKSDPGLREETAHAKQKEQTRTCFAVSPAHGAMLYHVQEGYLAPLTPIP